MKKAKVIISLLMALIMTATGMVSAFAASVDEKEPNNTAATATAFAVVDTVSGRISSADDVDWYSFEVAESSLITVKLSHTIVGANATSSYFNVDVYDRIPTEASTVSPEASFTSAGNVESSSSAAFSVASGKHYIKVTGGQVTVDSLAYSVSVTVDKNSLAEKEPNNTVATASPLELSVKGASKVYVGTISNETDVDYYKFTLPQNGYIYWYLYNGTVTTGDYKAELIGYVSGKDGIANEQSFGTVSLAKNETSIMGPSVGLSAGEYYLKVSGSVGDYQTRVYFAAHGTTESEYNNTFGTADLLLTGNTYYGSTFDVNDYDVFKFSVTKEKTELQFVFDVSAAKQNGKWRVFITNADGSILSGGELTAVKGEKVTYSLYDLKAGTYYVEVRADASAPNSENYKLCFETITVKEEEGDKSFIDQIKDLNWSKFLSNFSEWIGQINLIPMLKAIFESIGNVIGSLF